LCLISAFNFLDSISARSWPAAICSFCKVNCLIINS
jgi:hypothetical protein